ncbi:uncharacterized protein ACN2A1_013288 [Glossina fuscipes fuscipes]
MERKQQNTESFEDYYADIHDLTFRLRRKIPEAEMIKIMKSNVKPSLAALIFATKVESIGEFKSECKRAEKLLRESRGRPKHVSEIGQGGENGEGVHREAVEALAPRHGPNSDRKRENGGAMKHEKRWINTGNTSNHPNERHHLQPATSRTGQPKQEAAAAIATPQHRTTTPAPANAVRTAQSMASCQSPFHLMTCYVCGMPGDYFLRNPAEGTRENRCRCPFHNMRHEIFSAEIYRRQALTRRHGKILILRQRRKAYRRFQQKEISAIVSLEHDDRMFARTKVDNTEVTALLDTGASVSCCGAGATRFLENRRHRVIRLQNRHVKTADGSKTSVTGLITLPVEWEGETRSIEFYIVPELRQQFYFGIDFWKAFGLSVATKADTINSPSKCHVLDAISQGNDNSKSYRNSSLQLTDVKQNSLGEGKETLPYNTREKCSGSIEITSSTSPLRSQRQQPQQIQLNNAETTIAVISHHNQLLPSATPISDRASHANQNKLAKRTRINKNLSSQHSTRKSSRPHPPATTVTPNQHLHQSQKRQQREHSTPNHHPHQHHRHSVQNPQRLLSTKQPAGNSTTGSNFGTYANVTATAQHGKSCFQPAPQAYINQIPANLASSSRSTIINSELKFSTNTSGGTKNDGSSSRTPFDLAMEALRGSRPIDHERLLNLLQRIANESQQYRMQNQLLKGLLDLRNEQVRQLSHKVQVR